MSEFRADLHTHTSYSDGSMTPRELIFYAKAVGLSALSITDHDTVAAYKEASIAAKEAQILLGTGVEFSAVEGEESVHILGYDIDVENGPLHRFCEKHLHRRRERNQIILKKLGAKGMIVDPKELEIPGSGNHPIGRPHIAHVLMKKGYVKSMQAAFDLYLGEGKSCYDPGMPVTCEETISIIHDAGGKAFLAHPHFLTNKKFIDTLLNKPFDGIECYYSRCYPSTELKWVKIAKEKGLLMSGGSDFHGTFKPNIPLGCSWIKRETFDKIFQRNLIQ